MMKFMVGVLLVLSVAMGNGFDILYSPHSEDCVSLYEADILYPELSVLVDFLEEIDFLDNFTNPSTFSTLLAPDNSALEGLFEMLGTTPEQFLADPQLANVIMYHVIPDVAVFASDLERGMEAQTMLGQPLTVRLSDKVTFIGAMRSSANVVVADVILCEVLVHIIDEVLLPDFSNLF
eukprot:TRINITY_DN1940_c0_g4_i2.p2 TRINITY_DN1940_c0_g4~~TRINITY_DN1940_c0_g4_i2.p2  ORF type:complete len:178 (-),score=20.17 TRINITY_DN1940_c0_g4_i2:1884-2417(-)